ncbi:MAG: hypothetical protein ABIB79_03150, partial [archaeon]
MQSILKLLISTAVLALGFPIGSFLARLTKEELKPGQLWFKLIILICLVGAGVSAFFRNDTLMFSFLFIAVVTSRGLRK